MKIAIVYNRDSRRVINVFGVPNREKYGLESIKRITDALKKGGHQVISVEGDKDLIDNLEEFMPQVIKGERPGLVFNISYGIQGQARYTHVPGMLEMVGIPYVGSGPLAHSLALDKVVAKMIFRQQGIPTPDFVVMETPDDELPALRYPMIVKPKNEAVSFGLKVVQDEAELRAAAAIIFEKFEQAVLVEQYIDGREINVGVLGNSPPETFAPAELLFGDGPKVYSYEDKVGKSGRKVECHCPADIDPELAARAQQLAIKAFKSLGCYDCCRVDMRIDADGELYILEINSLPSLGKRGSYVVGAAHAGLDFDALVNRLVDVAAARYFGTPRPPRISTRDSKPDALAFGYLTERRERMERRLKEWTALGSRTNDPLGTRNAVARLEQTMQDIGMKRNTEYADEHHLWLWETERGYQNGILLIGHLDVPLDLDVPGMAFRRDPEWLYGEGVASSRGPLVMTEYALRALRNLRRLRNLPLGVLYYGDEGADCRYTAAHISEISKLAKKVLILRPGNTDESVITQRRGQRKYRLVVDGTPRAPGAPSRRPDALRWTTTRLEKLAELTSRKDFVSVSTIDMKTDAYPMLLPHRITTTLLVTYLDTARADAVEKKMRDIFGRERHWDLVRVAERPPMRERKSSDGLRAALKDISEKWDIPYKESSSVWPSVAGLVPPEVPVMCGVGPVATNLMTPHEAVSRLSLIQRTLLLTQLLVRETES